MKTSTDAPQAATTCPDCCQPIDGPSQRCACETLPGKHAADHIRTANPCRRIVAAANKCSDGTVICAVRHYDPIMRSVLMWLPPKVAASAEMQQGFVDSQGQFLTREEAWKVAEAAGQLLDRAPTDGRGGTLYSEDVW
ncbi:MAG: hypothetical protein AB7F35_00970 [Acetobacteraceae bacterium]